MPTTTPNQSGPGQPTPGRSRLPVAVDVPSRGAQVAKGLAALVGTALLVVGVPIALLAAFGTPWPDGAPSTDWFSRPADADTIIAVLAVVVWLAWLHFVVCLAVEAIAEVRRTGLAAHVPGGGLGTQALARRLVATIVLIGATAGVGVGTASAATAAPAERAPVAVAAPVAAQPVQAAAPDEGQLPATGDLADASAAVQESGATTYYDVKPPNGRHYDTLWDMADRYLGDGLRYKEIWELNRDVVQPDGRVLKNPDLIYPGWVMKMPSDASGPGLKVVEADAMAPLESTPPTETAGAADVSGADASAPGGAAVGDASTASTDESGPMVPAGWRPLFGAAGGLVVAGAVLALRRRRASDPVDVQWASRPTGARPDPTDPTDPTPDGAGPRLHDEADVDAATWLSSALRSWNDGAGTPQPARAAVSAAGIAVTFDDRPDREPPVGWTRHGDHAWALARETPVRGTGPSPTPGLVTVGARDDGSTLMVDLESVEGVTFLEGDDDVARGLALSMAVDTATHPWADRRVVSLIGFADDLKGVADGAIRRHRNLGRVLDTLRNTARFQRDATRAAGAQSARAARAIDPSTDWTYHLVVCSGVPSADELAELSALAADPAAAIAVVVVGEHQDAALRLSARPTGQVVAPLLGIDVEAQVLDMTATRELAALFERPEHGEAASLNDLLDVVDTEREVEAEAADVVAHVGLLGPIEVHTTGSVDPDRRALMTELLTYLALHPAGVHVNRLTAAIWPRGVDGEQRDAAFAELVAWLGAERPAVEQASGVWRLMPGAVRLDWDAFRDALNRSVHGKRRESNLRAALDLVRGPVLAEVPATRYGWLDSVTVQTDATVAVVLTAQALAETAGARGDHDAAVAALESGLTAAPASEELWRSRLHLEHARDADADLPALADRMYASIAEHGSPMGASAPTEALVDELIPGYRRSVA